MAEEKMFVMLPMSEPDRKEVVRFAEEAAGNVEVFRDLYRERFNVGPEVFGSDDPNLKNVNFQDRLIALN